MSSQHIRKLMKKMKSSYPEDRYEAIYEFHQLEVEEVEASLLIEIYATAANKFPESVGEWDNPSYFLVDFATTYISEKMIHPIKKHFHAYSPDCKQMCLEALVMLNTKEAFETLVELFERHANEEYVVFPYALVEAKSECAEYIFPKLEKYIDHKDYQIPFLMLLEGYLRAGALQPFRNEVIVPIVERELSLALEKYKEYDSAFTPKFAYKFWRETYLKDRFEWLLWIQLSRYYFNENIVKLLKQSLPLKDSLIQSHVVATLLFLNEEVSKEDVDLCATNPYSVNNLYGELSALKIESKFPKEHLSQEMFVAGELIHMLLQHEDFQQPPAEIEVLAPIVEGENVFYPVLFKGLESKENTWILSVIGPYEKSSIPTPYCKGGIACLFEEYNFENGEAQIKKYIEEYLTEKEVVLFIDKPKIFYPFILFLLIAFGVQSLIHTVDGLNWGDLFYLIPTVIFALGFKKSKRMAENSSLVLTTQRVLYSENGKEYSISLNEIFEVKKEKRRIHPSEGPLFMSLSVNHLVFYNDNGEEILSVREDCTETTRLRNYLVDYIKLPLEKVKI